MDDAQETGDTTTAGDTTKVDEAVAADEAVVVNEAAAVEKASTTGGPAWLDAEELAAWVNLIKLSSRLVTLSDTELRRTSNLTGRDYELLHHLSSSATGHRVNELADLIDDTSSCITHRVNRLQAAGLVAKAPDEADQRARRVALTARGRALLERTAPAHVARVRAWVVDPLERADLLELGRIAGVLHRHLRDAAPPSM